MLILPALLASRHQPPTPLPGAIVAARPLLAPACATTQGLARVVYLAEVLRATLTPAQLAQVQRPYSRADAARWSNFPQQFSRPPQAGIALEALTPAAGSVTAVGVPNEDYDELEVLLALYDAIAQHTYQTSAFGTGNPLKYN